jgi:hypothetical protein
MGNIGKPRRRIEVLPDQTPATQPEPVAPVPERAPTEPARTNQVPSTT